jgi:hypothetical protein
LAGVRQREVRSIHYLDQDVTEVVVQLRPLGLRPGGLASRAIDWFVKGLASPFDADKFVAYWVATELLWKIDGEPLVSEPYTTRCNHVTHDCPVCGSDISKPVLGSSVKAYLVRRGISQDDATKLWELRQVVHGSRDLSDDELLNEVPRLVQLLRADGLLRIKELLGLAPTDPPITAPGPIMREMGLGGSRKLEDD